MKVAKRTSNDTYFWYNCFYGGNIYEEDFDRASANWGYYSW